jgi:hypothetical protein
VCIWGGFGLFFLHLKIPLQPVGQDTGCALSTASLYSAPNGIIHTQIASEKPWEFSN